MARIPKTLIYNWLRNFSRSGRFFGATIDAMEPLSYPEFIRLRMIELRKTQGLSQKDFGGKIGLSSQAVSALELGKNEWSLSHMSVALFRFGLPVTFFNRSPSSDQEPAEDGTASMLKESSRLMLGLKNLSPASKKALFKYSQLTDDQRALVDRLILNTAKSQDTSIIKAFLSLLRKSIR